MGEGRAMIAELLLEATPPGQPGVAPESLDTVRALCHDLRQPLAAIRLLAGAKGGDLGRRMDTILDQAQWLTDMVEGVIGDAVDDQLVGVDVIELVSRCVAGAQITAESEIGLTHKSGALALAAPVALSRAVSCVLDNAVRAAGPSGRVAVEVTRTTHQIIIGVTDDGPGLGLVLTENSLGPTITRALVAACRGGFALKAATPHGVEARIVIPRLTSTVVTT
jgi:signal transduction histidine kinase